MSPALPKRPLLPGLYHVVPLDADRVEVCNAGRSVALSGPGLAAQATALLEALDGHASVEALTVRFGDLTEPLLHSLLERGLLVDAAPEADSAQAAPERASLAIPGGPSPAEAADRLARATVTIVGCGPVGATVAMLLAKAGAGRLVLGDTGVWAPSEVATCPVVAPDSQGRPRADAVADVLQRGGSTRVEVTSRPVPSFWLATSDLVVTERPLQPSNSSRDDHDGALAAGVSCLFHGQDGLLAVIGPLVGRGGGPCHLCAETRRLSHVPHLHEHLAYLRHRVVTAPAPDSFLAAHTSLVAGLIAVDVLRSLVGAVATTAGGVLVADLATMEVRRETVLAVPGCPYCARLGAAAVMS